jgi:hypothetical protein
MIKEKLFRIMIANSQYPERLSNETLGAEYGHHDCHAAYDGNQHHFGLKCMYEIERDQYVDKDMQTQPGYQNLLHSGWSFL